MRLLGIIWLVCSALSIGFACIYATYRVFEIDGTVLPWVLPFAYAAIFVGGGLLSIPGLVLLVLSEKTRSAKHLDVVANGPTLEEIVREQQKQA